MSTSTPVIDISNIDHQTLIATIIIAILGWIVALVLQRSNTKHQHKIQVRYDIYKQLLKVTEQTQDKINKLATAYPPFILMESSMIPFNLKIPKEYKGAFIDRSEHECVFEGEKEWNKFVAGIFDDYFAFTNQYLEMVYIFEGWAAAIEPLIKTQKVFTEEVNVLRDVIYKNASKLQCYANENEHDWRKWNKEEIEAISKEIRDKTYTIGMYLHDFMVLVHNELLSKYFKYQKPIRKTLDPEYKVLTKDGLVIRLEENHEELLKKFQDGEKAK